MLFKTCAMAQVPNFSSFLLKKCFYDGHIQESLDARYEKEPRASHRLNMSSTTLPLELSPWSVISSLFVKQNKLKTHENI